MGGLVAYLAVHAAVEEGSRFDQGYKHKFLEYFYDALA